MKIFRFAGLLAMVGSVASAQVASPAAPIPTNVLRPDGPWNVDYAPDECRLIRAFGKDDKQIILRLARGSGLREFDFVVAGPSIPKLQLRLSGAIRLSPQGIEQKSQGYSMPLPNTKMRFVRFYDLDTSIFHSITGSQILEVTADKAFSVSLLLTGSHAAIDALNTCYDDLLVSWGLDPAKLREPKFLPTPTGNPGNWATTSDYPKEALRNNLAGEVRFMVIVDEQGKTRDCKVVHGSGVPMLDQTTCSLILRRARFKPARDASGNAMVSYYVNRVRWMIPND